MAARQSNPKKFDYIVYKNEVAVSDGTVSAVNIGDATHAAWNKHVKGALREIQGSPNFYRGIGHGDVSDTRVEVRPHAKTRRCNAGDECADLWEDDRYDATAEAIETYVQQHADQDLAMSLSTLNDTGMIELERAGYDDQSAIAIAKVGDEEAVNGDILVPPHFEQELGIQKDVRHPVPWSQAKLTTPMYKWLKSNGYVKTDRGGTWPSDESIEIRVSDMTAHLGGTPDERKWIRQVAEDLVKRNKLSGASGIVYGSPSNGKIEIYAKRIATDNPSRGKPARAGNPRHSELADRLARGGD